MLTTMKTILAIVAASLALSACIAATIRGDNNEESLGPAPHLVGGNRADPSHSKYTVELTLYSNNDKFKRCGAARFNKHWFVTAAECLNTTRYDLIEVTVPNDDPKLKYHKTVTMLDNLITKIHPGYKGSNENNIAVFRLKKTHTHLENYLALPRKSDQKESFLNRPVVISSWVHAKKAPTGNLLGDTYISVLSSKVAMPSVCQKQYPKDVDEKFHICAVSSGTQTLTKDDAGIPLVLEGKDKPVLIGIGSSILPPKGETSLSMVFTKITPFAEWISKETSVELHD